MKTLISMWLNKKKTYSYVRVDHND